MTKAGEDFQAALDAAVAAHPQLPGVALSVRARRLGLDWSGAAGRTERGGAGAPLSGDTPFRLASVTKTFVAAAVIRLAEDGRLSLSDPIGEVLSPAIGAALAKGGYDLTQIRVDQLLTHTSGLYDHAQDPTFHTAVSEGQGGRWSRLDQVEFNVRHGAAYAAPGELQRYSDTGYVLLGDVVETASGRSLAEAVRSLLGFDRLGLARTWWEVLEPDRAPRAHQYWGERDTFGYDPSFDLWGGGGLVSTTDDLARFFQALFEGEVFARPETLAAALQVPRATRAKADSVHSALVYDLPLAGVFGWAHAGFWGGVGTYYPELGAAIALTANQNDNPGQALGDVLMTVLRTLRALNRRG
jgi:D-alanyl-D-alanine carboxypeptidase